MSKPKLTVKQETFIIEYIKNKGNATQAAIKAGYSKNTAKQIGQENLTKLDIKNEIERRLLAKQKKKVAQADEVLELLTKFARGSVKEEQIVVEGRGDGHSSAKIMKRKIANRDQLNALDKLARIHGLYNDKVNISTSNDSDDLITITLGELKNREVEEVTEDE